ncbi:MAG: YdiU family protein [Rickettsiales bacterium]|nr:YdiU family protein [Rickettsiales bacterium]
MNFFNHFENLGTDFFSKITTTPLENSFVAAYSPSACTLLDFDPQEFLKPEFCKFTNPNFCNLAMLYAGHQFGHFVPQLGDGRAALLAQISNQKNESWDLVLKGAGLTPYSRMGDGKAVLRSSIREFLVSEAMFHLGIPTSRALCLIASEEKIHRDGMEKAAQIIRLAPSHVRFGSFEVFFYRKQNEQIKILADYVIEQNFSQLKNHPNKYSEFLAGVVESTAKLIAKWQAFGFCHGVLNTDNMSILGITFDYGPFGFLDAYNPHHICNHSDFEGRYSFANQPAIGLWNLHAFAITLSSLVSMEEQKEILANYEKFFYQEFYNLMAQKLGFTSADENTKKLTHEVLDLLEQHQIDYTFFFYNLTNLDVILSLSKDDSWHKALKSLHPKIPTTIQKNTNPKFILRNHLLQTAIEKADLANDFSEVKKLLKIMQNPFDEQPENESYASLPPTWAKEISISCSS